MNKKYIRKLLSSITQRIIAFRAESPRKFKYIIISSSGAVVLTLSILIVSTSLPLLKSTLTETASIKSTSMDSTSDKNAVSDSSGNSVLAAENFSAKAADNETKKVSRGKTSLNPLNGDTIKLGTKDSIVIDIQKKLMELDYIESDEPSEEYGEALQEAVKLFQRKNELNITGEVDKETYQCLISDNAKEYTVFIGAEGTDVEQLQTRLYELGYLQKVTSYFGTDTEAAVKEFQKRNGLGADGNVGKNTREILYSSNAIPLSFHLGDENDEILKYQKRLYELGYMTTPPDSKYGNDTVNAVKSFQDNNGLIADGYIGPATKELLMSGDAEEYAVKTGDSGDAVTNIQEYLKKLGYLRGATGYFGSDTYNAVINFQKKNGLTADGKVGSQTISKLLSPNAKRWTGGSSGSSSGGSNSGSGSSGGSGSSNGNSGTASGSLVESIISIAQSKIGARYVYGAKGPNTFDCSGFVYWVLNRAGIKQSYMTSFSWQNTARYQKITSMKSIKRGDIISYHGHVGIAIGNGQMIDASSSQGKVRITSINSSYWINNFVCAYRIL